MLQGPLYLATGAKSTNYGYHKLPGGGIESGESAEDALYRELLEEIGCPAKIEKGLGEIEEGMKTVIAKDIDEAIALLKNDEPTNYEGSFIQKRGVRFLHEAKSVA